MVHFDRPPTRQGYLWTCHRPGGDVVYDWQTGRGADCLEEIVPAGFEGTVQSDGYQAYGSFARSRGEAITLAGCWAHVRRKFYEAQEEAPRVAGFILRQIQGLYAIEARLREERAGPKLRAARRAAQSRPIIEWLHRVFVRLRVKKHFLPKAGLGQAIDYALGQWRALVVYLEQGRVEIDNNPVENAIRPTAIGKKNWLFIGEADAGERSAIIYTLVECCRRRGLDPYAYLRDVLTRLPSTTNWKVNELTPEAWSSAMKPGTARQAT